MLLLIGPNTLAGQAFAAEMQSRGLRFAQLDPANSDLADLNVLYDAVRRVRPVAIINAASVVYGQNGQISQNEKDQALRLNVLLPQTIARVCQMRNISMGHVSSGTIYRGAKILSGRKWIAEIDLHRKEVAGKLRRDPSGLCGFGEDDEPNHSFLCPPCDFYSGTIALGEHAISSCKESYVWRSGLFFLEQHHPQNLLSRDNGGEACDGNGKCGQVRRIAQRRFVSVTHLGEFASGCLDLLQRRAPFGIYHIVNPGIVDVMGRLKRFRPFGARKVTGITDNGAAGEQGAQHDFLLDGTKARSAGVIMRDADAAVEDSLRILYPKRKQGYDPSAAAEEKEAPKCLDSM